MKIAVYGATGNVGSRVAAEAVRRGHEVTGISRSAATLPDGVTSRLADAGDVDAARAIASEHDVVVSAVGPSREPGGDRRAYLDVIRDLADAVGGTRLVVVGGAGSLRAADGRRLVDQEAFPEIYKAEALVAAEALEILRAAPESVDWAYLSPAPEIGPGERTGRYLVGLDEPVGGRISYEDYAAALLDEIENPQHRRRRFTVANG